NSSTRHSGDSVPPSYVLVFASSSAHAVATPEFGSLPPRGVAHPPASINSRCLHESIFWNSASFAAALGCCMNPATQEGVRTATNAELLRSTAMRSAVLPRVQPNHVKPMIMIPIAPTTTPQAAGLNHGTRITHSLRLLSPPVLAVQVFVTLADATSFPEKGG